MKIIIAGYGFVGEAVANTLKKKHDLIVVDPKYTRAFRKYAYGLNKPITVLDSAIDYNETVRKDVDL